MKKYILLICLISLYQELISACRVIEEKANGIITSRRESSAVVLLEAYVGYDKKYLCSGTLISNEYVLTTRSCVFGSLFVNVHVNAYLLRDEFEDQREIYRSSEIIIHENPDGLNYINDIALVKLDSFSNTGKDYITFAQLPTMALADGTIGKTIGFGLLNFVDDHASSRKQELSMQKISAASCESAYSSLTWNNPSGRICIKRSMGPNCVSDIGSPFIVDNVVYGIQSFGQLPACDSEDVPNGLQDIFHHVDWIKGKTGL